MPVWENTGSLLSRTVVIHIHRRIAIVSYPWLDKIIALGLTKGGVGLVQGCIAERLLCVISDCYGLLCIISPATGFCGTESATSYMALSVAAAFTPV